MCCRRSVTWMLGPVQVLVDTNAHIFKLQVIFGWLASGNVWRSDLEGSKIESHSLWWKRGIISTNDRYELLACFVRRLQVCLASEYNNRHFKVSLIQRSAIGTWPDTGRRLPIGPGWTWLGLARARKRRDLSVGQMQWWISGVASVPRLAGGNWKGGAA